MNHDTSNCRLTGQLAKCSRIAAVCVVLTALALIAAVTLGSFEAPAAAPKTTAAARASVSTIISYEKPTLASVGFPVECSQAPSGLDCLYY